MAFQISPGVNVSEIDLTTIIPAVSTTEGAAVGEFLWGPLNERVLLDSEDRLVARFWKPDNNIANRWFTSANFLSYGNALYQVRVASEGSNSTYNATSEATTGSNTAGAGFLVKNDDDYEDNWDDGTLNCGEWIAKYPGTLGNSLKVSMCPSSAAYESTLTGTVTVTANSTTVTGSGTSFVGEVEVGDLLTIFGKEIKVSAVGNTISLTLASAHSNGASGVAVTRRWEYHNLVDTAPGTSAYANNLSGTADEMHVVVIDEDGDITGTAGQVLERYPAVSAALDAKQDDGSTNYYKEVLNQQSQWIRWADHLTVKTNAGSNAKGVTFGTPSKPSTRSLAGGRRGAAPSNADFIRGYDKFKDADDVDVSLILGGDANQTIATHVINNITETRKDCVVCLSPLRANVVDNIGDESSAVKTYRDTLPSSSYAVMDSGWKYQYDKYFDLYRYVPLNGDIAGLMVRTDLAKDPWWSPAGYNRGHVKNVYKLAYNPAAKADRDRLYKASVNPILTVPGQGTVMFGDKTMLAKPSAFDRINVRRLFIVLEKAIATAAKFMLFEFNDEFTRAQFRNMVNPFLRDVQGRRGITDFQVVADSTNNTPEVIDRNEFVGDIYVVPARAINFIQLNFVAVRTGVEFSEIVGKF